MTARRPDTASLRRCVRIAAALALLAGCQTPGHQAVIAPLSVQRVTHAQRPATARESRPRTVTARLSFEITAGACDTRATFPDGSLALTVAKDHFVRLALAGTPHHPLAPRAPRTVQAAFTGPLGSWKTVLRRDPHRVFRSSLPLDQAALSGILALISGGILHVETRNEQVLAIHLIDSGIAGRDWFGCVRGKSLGD